MMFVVVGWLMARWAARYDVRSWVTDAIWRFVWKRGWRNMRKAKIEEVLDRDGEFRRQVSSSAEAFKADAARWGRTGAATKHGVLFATATVVSNLAGLFTLVGLLALAHAGYRLL